MVAMTPANLRVGLDAGEKAVCLFRNRIFIDHSAINCNGVLITKHCNMQSVLLSNRAF